MADLGQRTCDSASQCHEVMTAERHRVFQRIQEMAESGDPVGIGLAEDFTSPDQLLNGGGPDGQDTPERGSS